MTIDPYTQLDDIRSALMRGDVHDADNVVNQLLALLHIVGKQQMEIEDLRTKAERAIELAEAGLDGKKWSDLR